MDVVSVWEADSVFTGFDWWACQNLSVSIIETTSLIDVS